MNTHLTDFPITIVSSDRTALRELAWSLRSLRFQNISSADWRSTAIWRHLDHPTLLLLDARDHQEIRDCLETPRSPSSRYRIAFHDAITETDAERLIDLGIDDIIAYPVNPGELYSRIQTGLRRLEFEKRLAQQDSYDRELVINTGSGFVRQLESRINHPTSNTDSLLLALSIDHQDVLGAQFGSVVTDLINNTVAKSLVEQTTGEDYFASLEDGVFLVSLACGDAGEGVTFAELIVKEFQAQKVLSRELREKITFSGAVLPLPTTTSAEEIVQRALSALQQVKDSGGNLITDASPLEQAFSAWEDQNSHSNLCRDTLAKHIMDPLPFVLPIEQSSAPDCDPLELFTLQSDAPQPPCSVAVDHQTRFLGIVDQSYFDQLGSDVCPLLEEHLVPTTASVDESKPLGELAELMDGAGTDFLVVLNGEKPVGYLTRDKLAAAIPISLAEQAIAPSYSAGHDLEALVVPTS